MGPHAVSYQLMPQQSNGTSRKILLPRRLSTAPHTAWTHLCLYRIHIEHCPLPICMPSLPSWVCPSHALQYCGSSRRAFVFLRLARSSRCRPTEPLSFPGCHAQVNPWSLTLKCIAGGLGERAVSEGPPGAAESQQRAPDTRQAARGPAPLSSSQTGAIKFSPHYLRQPHHRLVFVGEGKGKTSCGGGWRHSLPVCECVIY